MVPGKSLADATTATSLWSGRVAHHVAGSGQKSAQNCPLGSTPILVDGVTQAFLTQHFQGIVAELLGVDKSIIYAASSFQDDVVYS